MFKIHDPSLWWLVTDDLMAYRRQSIQAGFMEFSDLMGCLITELITNTNISKLNE